MSSSVAASRTVGGRREAVAFLAAWIPYAVLTKAFWFVTDDAFISFRYALHWAEGHGLRYNLDEVVPVEGYSNFLWVLFCGMVERLGGDVTFWAPLVSFVTGTVLLALVFRTLRRRLGADLPVAVLATLSLGTFAPYFVWSTGGLATVPFALALFVAYERMILRREGPAPLAAALAALAASLLRVEGVAWAVLVGLGAMATGRLEGRRVRAAMVRYFAAVGVGFAVYLIWRFDYHGSLVANTATAKVGMSAAVLERGAEYLATYVLTFLTPLLLIPAYVVAMRRETRALGLPTVGLSLAAFGYAVAVGGDFMTMGRLLVPALPLNALLFGMLVQRLAAGGAARRRTVLGLAGASVALAMLPVADVHLVPESVRTRFNVRRHWQKYWTEIEYWNVMRLNGDRTKRLGLALREWAQPTDSVVTPGIGNVGYWSGLRIHDLAGLVDRDVAGRETEEATAPGHDKIVGPEFFLPDRPTYILPHLVEDGPELERTRAMLEAEAGRLLDGWGAHYAAMTYVPFLRSPPPPRLPPDAESAVVANLLAPLRPVGGTGGPREVVVTLRRIGE